MREVNPEELRARGALQDMQVRANSMGGLTPSPHSRHAQLETWWERALALVVAAILLAALVDNLWRAL
jgi:hypothetical protein